MSYRSGCPQPAPNLKLVAALGNVSLARRGTGLRVIGNQHVADRYLGQAVIHRAGGQCRRCRTWPSKRETAVDSRLEGVAAETSDGHDCGLTSRLNFETVPRSMKEARFVGSSLDDLRALPKAPRQDVGRQVDRVQRGLDPHDWRPMLGVGSGVREIRVRDEANNYRCMYVANIGNAVHVLHVFVKKSQKTPLKDIEIAKSRLKAVLAESRRGR